MNKLIILDRDGVINQDSLTYIKSPDEFIFLPGSIDAIVRLTKARYTIAVATNQSGVSRGLYNIAQLDAIHTKMIVEIKAAGGDIDKIEYCTHMPDIGCNCRKPAPGMLQSIAKHYQCSLQDVIFVGDRISDIEAAYAAKAKPVLVLSSMTDQSRIKDYPEVLIYLSLAKFVDDLLVSNNE